MDDDLALRLQGDLLRLHERARALSHPGGDEDKAQMFSTLALQTEALLAIAGRPAIPAGAISTGGWKDHKDR